MNCKKEKPELDIAQLEDACKKTLQNAQQLYKESRLLFDNNRFARSFFLLRIANEELGKCLYIIEAIIRVLNCDNVDWNVFWLRFYKHQEKTLISEYTISMFEDDEQYKVDQEQVIKLIPFYEYLKLSSLYVDNHNDGFQLPSEYINEEITVYMLEVIGKRLSYFDYFVSKEFIESVRAQIANRKAE